LNVFLPVNAKQGWLVISGIVSWLPIGQQFLIDFFCHSRLIPISWRNLPNCTPTAEKVTNAAPLAASQSGFSRVNYTVLHLGLVTVDKNKPLSIMKPT
jgi:hypothetical protein